MMVLEIIKAMFVVACEYTQVAKHRPLDQPEAKAASAHDRIHPKEHSLLAS